MLIVLPWPDKRLSPNARLHFRVVALVKAQARKDGANTTYAALPCGLREVRQHFAGTGPIACQVTFYPPDNRHRDDDNMIGSFKAARDGIADALGVNDRRFRPMYIFADPCKPGAVIVQFIPGFGQIDPCKAFAAQSAALEQSEAERCPNTARPISATLMRSATDACQ